MARLAPAARCRIGGRLCQRPFAQSLLHPTEPHEPSVLSPRPGGARTQVIEREESELENSISATTERDYLQGEGANRYCLRQRRRWRICSLWGHHRGAFRQSIQHQCEGNAVYGAKGLTAIEGWWLHHSQRLGREC